MKTQAQNTKLWLQ